MGNSFDKGFFCEVYDQTFDGLRRYVRSRVCHPSLAEDIVQEVYEEVFRHIKDLKKHVNYKGWIYKTANNKVNKINSVYNKHVKNEVSYNEEIAGMLSNDEQLDYMANEELRQILNEDDYELLMKKYSCGYTYKRLALMMGTTESCMKKRISRIVKKVREYSEKSGT